MTRARQLKLNMIQSQELCNLIQKEYATSNMSDTEFAEHASKVLGFTIVSNHVQTRRSMLHIKATMKPVQRSAMEEQLDLLVNSVLALTKRVETLENLLGDTE